MKIQRMKLLLSLFCVLLEVNSQAFPYVSFMGQTLANNSYVDFSLVGISDSNSVVCHTDLSTCCSKSQGVHHGDWHFPNGSKLPFSGDIFESRRAQRVDLLQSGGNSPGGIYCCSIATNAIHDDYDISVRENVCVGLYSSNGGMH